MVSDCLASTTKVSGIEAAKRFSVMVEQHLDSLEPRTSVIVSQRQYDQWAAGFVFEAMRDQRYGQSFCNRFGIKDYVLYHARDLAWADAYIRKNYIR